MSVIAAVGGDTYKGLTGYKRPLLGNNPTRLPTNLPSFRGVKNDPGNSVRAGPIKSSANRNNRGTNVAIPYSRLTKNDALFDIGRLNPGDIAFIQRSSNPGDFGMSPEYGDNQLGAGPMRFTRLVGVDFLNRILERENWAERTSSGRFANILTQAEYNDAVRDGTAKYNRARNETTESGSPTKAATRSRMLGEGHFEQMEATRAVMQVPTLHRYQPDGIVHSNDAEGDAMRDGKLYNVHIQGVTAVNNGFMDSDGLGMFSRAYDPVDKARADLDAYERRVNKSGAAYHLYPTQMFDRKVNILNYLYVGLAKTLHDSDEDMKQAGTNAPFYSFKYVLFSDAQWWETFPNIRDSATDDAQRATKRQRLFERSGEGVLRERDSTDKYYWNDTKKQDLGNLIGAWRIGTVIDTKAATMEKYVGGPIDSNARLTVNVCIEWVDKLGEQLYSMRERTYPDDKEAASQGEIERAEKMRQERVGIRVEQGGEQRFDVLTEREGEEEIDSRSMQLPTVFQEGEGPQTSGFAASAPGTSALPKARLAKPTKVAKPPKATAKKAGAPAPVAAEPMDVVPAEVESPAPAPVTAPAHVATLARPMQPATAFDGSAAAAAEAAAAAVAVAEERARVAAMERAAAEVAAAATPRVPEADAPAAMETTPAATETTPAATEAAPTEAPADDFVIDAEEEAAPMPEPVAAAPGSKTSLRGRRSRVTPPSSPDSSLNEAVESPVAAKVTSLRRKLARPTPPSSPDVETPAPVAAAPGPAVARAKTPGKSRKKSPAKTSASASASSTPAASAASSSDAPAEPDGGVASLGRRVARAAAETSDVFSSIFGSSTPTQGLQPLNPSHQVAGAGALGLAQDVSAVQSASAAATLSGASASDGDPKPRSYGRRRTKE